MRIEFRSVTAPANALETIKNISGYSELQTPGEVKVWAKASGIRIKSQDQSETIIEFWLDNNLSLTYNIMDK